MSSSTCYTMPSYWTPIHSLSDARSEPLPTNKRKRTSDIPPIQAPLPSSAASTSATLAQTVPQRTSDKGVYRIGDRYLLSVDAPVVHALIAYMNEHWALPATPNLNKNVVVLAALQVAIHPTQAAHWVFWNDKERQRTQEMCKKHCAARPRAIHYTGTYVWEEDFIMLYHTRGWHTLIESKPWYSRLAQKPSQAPPGPTTRRRNRAAATESPATATSSSDPQEDIPPPAKRARTQPKRKAVASSSAAQTTPRQVSSPSPPPIRVTRSTPSAFSTLTSLSSASTSPADSLPSISTIRPLRQRSNSQTSGTIVGSDRSVSVTTAVETTPSPQNEKELLIEVCDEAPRRSTRSAKKRSSPSEAKTSQSYRTVRPRASRTPLEVEEDAVAPSMTAIKAASAKPPARARRIRAAQK